MEKYALLLGYFEKQVPIIEKLYGQVRDLDVTDEDKGYVFALKVHQLYTAIEDLFKQIAEVFENKIQDPAAFRKELLLRMNLTVPQIRPAVIGDDSLRLLDKLRAFRHFVRHAYDVELDTDELLLLQNKLNQHFSRVIRDLEAFRKFTETLLASPKND
ncbi:MAG: hypothetical protein D6681_20805 [Calditrichaeota bacterium]|nr:MAG: hypothetical protein D6681_20805 [Calditrichota bacterium]